MRKSRLIYMILFSAYMFTGCNSGNADVVVFENDFEGHKGWCEIQNLSEGKAHSGRFSNAVSSASPYGAIFRIKYKDISKTPVSYLRFSVWCYAEDLPVDAKLVVSVDSDTTMKLLWKGWDLPYFIDKSKEWIEVTGEMNLGEKKSNSPENTFVFYLWGNGKSNVYADDFHFEFSKR